MEKIKAADKFIERLKFGGDSPTKKATYDIAEPGSSGFASDKDLIFLK